VVLDGLGDVLVMTLGDVSDPRPVLPHHAEGRIDPTTSLIAGALYLDGSAYDCRDRFTRRSSARLEVRDLFVGELDLHTSHVQHGSWIVKMPSPSTSADRSRPDIGGSPYGAAEWLSSPSL
jgi:hypothetical protein